MSLTWHQIERSAAAEPSRDGAVAGAVPCVVGKRVYLVGGTATKRGDPDISLSVYNYWWSRPECESRGERQRDDIDSARTNHTAAAVKNTTRAGFAKTDGASQEGDIPPARIGQAAVVHPSRSSIIVFGGETTSAVAGVPFAKLSDVYEGVPKEPSGTLVWRSLLLSGNERPAGGDGGTTCAAGAETPSPVAFHATCVASIRGEWAMIVHGGVDQNTALLGDLWAFRCQRGDEGRTDGADSNKQPTEFSWERLAPDGQGPPPTAYHSASPVNGGKVVVFLVGLEKGPETLLGSSVFLLDTAVGNGMAWSSFPVTGLLGRRMHSAISVTAIDAQRPYQNKQDEGKLDHPSSSPEVDAALIRGGPEAPLWKPRIEAASSKLGGAGVGSVGNHGASRGGDDDAEPQDGDNAPAFESILIFGGVVDGSVIGDATLLEADGTLEQLPLGRRSCPTPECRYNHAMVSVQDGRQALLVGGCRGDGTRLHDAFVLDLTGPDERDGGDDGQEGRGALKEAQITTVTLDNGDVYVGQLDEGGRRHGEGRCDYLGSGGGWYTGTWEADDPHGRGERVYPAEGGQQNEGLDGAFAPGRAPPLASYKGDWKRGVRDGNGVCAFTTPTTPSVETAPSTVPDRYEGQWVGGVPLGKGVLYLRVKEGATDSAMIAALRNSSDSGNSNSGFIEGEWKKKGLVRGRETLPDRGGIYEGQYRQGRREGHGRLELADGSEFEGAWKNGRQNGFGTFRCGVTRQVYTGKWVGGVRCGRGACDYPSGCRYEGLWLDGKKHGEGILSLPTGDSLRGVWHRDELVPSMPDSAMPSYERG